MERTSRRQVAENITLILAESEKLKNLDSSKKALAKFKEKPYHLKRMEAENARNKATD